MPTLGTVAGRGACRTAALTLGEGMQHGNQPAGGVCFVLRAFIERFFWTNGKEKGG